MLKLLLGFQKKGGNVKTIPPYKPIPADNGSSDSSPEKETDSMVKAGVSGKRKSTAKTATATSSAVGSKVGPTAGKTVVGGHSPSIVDGVVAVPGGDLLDAAKSSSPAPNVANVASSVSANTKFTTSNFVETVVTQSESVFGADVPTGGQSVRMSVAGMPASVNSTTASAAASISGKKRKAGNRTPTNPDTVSDMGSIQVPVSVMSSTVGLPATVSGSIPVATGSMTITSSGVTESHALLGDTKKLKVETSNPMPSSTISESVVVRPMTGNVITSAPSSTAVTSGSIVVSVPLAATSIQPPTSATNTVVTSAPTLFQQLQQSIVVANNAAAASAAAAAASAAAATTSQVQLQQQPPPQPQPQQPQPQIDDQPGKRAR